MKFANPLWLSLLPFVCVGAVWYIRSTRKQIRARFALFNGASAASGEMADLSCRRHVRRLLLFALALAALIAALARPLGGLRPESGKGHGVNVLLALDASRSMLVEDVGMARFELARQALDELVASFSGDRAGLLLFAGQANLIVPPTFDYASLRLVQGHVGVDSVGRGGTSLTLVIERAAEYFRNQPHGERVLILFTDGEETEGDAVLAAEKAHRLNGLRIFTFGAGTNLGGRIPKIERNTRREWVRNGEVRDAVGRVVISRADDALLRRIAAVAGGEYVDLAARSEGWAEFYKRALLPLAGPLEATRAEDYRQLFPICLALALLLLVLERFLVGRAAGASARTPASADADVQKPSIARSGSGAIASAGMWLALLFIVSPAEARVGEAAELLERGEFERAFTILQELVLTDPTDERARYNYAVGAYALGRYDTATKLWEELSSTENEPLSLRSRFQLGNGYYRQGGEMLAVSREGAVALWEKALATYQRADPDARVSANFATVRGELSMLLGRMSDDSLRRGDDAARVDTMQGVADWRDSMSWAEKGLSVANSPAEETAFTIRRVNAVNRLFRAFLGRADDQRRRAAMQRVHALDRAIELMGGALADYGEALATKPGDAAAQKGREETAAVLVPWRVELADRIHADGLRARTLSVIDALNHWQRAANVYSQVLIEDAENAGALGGQKRNNRAMHDAHVELGAAKELQAEQASWTEEGRDSLLEESFRHYVSALNLEPEETATQQRVESLGGRLAVRLARRGARELEQAQSLEEKNVPEAIAWAERAIQSFAFALRFAPELSDAAKGREDALALLSRLRARDARDQKRVLAEGKDLQDPKDLENPGDLALKLLDLDNDRLASKKQQNLSAPENSPTRDW